MMYVYVNGVEAVKSDYPVGFEADVPIVGSKLNIEVRIGDVQNPSKTTTTFQYSFDIEHGKDYQCEFFGKLASKMRLSKPDETVDEDDHVYECKNNSKVVFDSFLFPIYGLYIALTNQYNRRAGIIGGSIGLVLAFIFSACAGDDEIGIGFSRNSAILTYEPFSFTDLIVNLLVGGIASFRGLIWLLFQ